MRKVVYVLLIMSVGLTSAIGDVSALAQGVTSEAQALLEEMTAAERIGQLFLVTMNGNAITEDHPIVDLISNHHIAGVMLSAGNDNFVDEPDTLEAARSLIASLQEVEFDSSLSETIVDPVTGATRRPRFIPLFIGIDQEGGGAPYAEILSGLTDIPSAMAIGATWDSQLAYEVGGVLGSELSALGFNLLLGPSLDVLDEPRLVGEGDLGVRTFGGDPFWVSVMGRAYVAGLQVGSEGRLAIIGKHFPGLGDSDRNTLVEVPTIRRSLDQLMQIELVPFAAVTNGSPGESGVVDGLLSAHIRYQGFQGNIRAATRPVSLDAQALLTLLGTNLFSGWREGGGVVVSDSLGARSIRRFYDPSETVFKGYLVARDALIAGNDLLQMSAIESTEDSDGLGSIKATLAFFEQKYTDDPVFAERVDDAALRIIELKLRLYGGSFALSRLHPRSSEMNAVGSSGETTFEVARRGATLVSPPQAELAEALGEPPSAGEMIVLFTDVREARQCSVCMPIDEMGMDDLAGEMLDLYGPLGTGQVSESNLSSFSTADLAAYLGETPPGAISGELAPSAVIDSALQEADWVVFSVLKSSDDVYGSNALKLLLDRRPDVVREKRVVVFSYDVPYDVDATDLSKIDAYFALYSRSEAFVEIAARMLFQELPAQGASPVNVPGVGYELIEALAPDPGQLISLSIASGAEGAQTPEGTATGFRRGDLIHVSTGVIVDANGNPVPDGTPVIFDIAYQAEGVSPLRIETITARGIASMSLTIDRLGMMTIQAMSDLATTSQVLQLDVQEDAFAFVTVIAPTTMLAATSGPTATSSLVTPTPLGDTQGGASVEEGGGTGLLDLVIAMIGVAIVSLGGFVLTRRLNGAAESTAIRYALIGAVCALVAYDYMAMNLPGSAALLESGGVWASLVVTVGMGVLGQTAWAVTAALLRKIRAS